MMKCGKCKGRHESVADVKSCYRVTEVADGRGGWVPSTQHGPARPVQQKLDIPAGHYATVSRTGNNDLDFWRVDRPTQGRWAGYTFVKRVIGGRPDHSVRGQEARQALEAIDAASPARAALRYGQEIGRCYRCNRHLTDETSRELGIGPDCRATAA